MTNVDRSIHSLTWQLTDEEIAAGVMCKCKRCGRTFRRASEYFATRCVEPEAA